MSRRPPRTAAGYLAPPEARVRGWHCTDAQCSAADLPGPRAWPFPCPQCGRPTEPTFEEPWAHEARGYELRRDAASPDPYRRAAAESELRTWTYRDARQRGDAAAAAAAWQAAGDALLGAGADHGTIPYELVSVAAEHDDLDPAIDLLLAWYPAIDTRSVADNSLQRSRARSFVSLCIAVLERESSVGHPREAALDAAMRELHDRHPDIPMHHHRTGFQRIGELRARRRTQHSIGHARRSTLYDALPPLSASWSKPGRIPRRADDQAASAVWRFGVNQWRAMNLADRAIEAAQTHGDTGPLDALIERLERAGEYPALIALIRARRRLIDGDLDAALRVLEQAVSGAHRVPRWLGPQLYATLGLLWARRHPAAIDQAVKVCREARSLAWSRVTTADTALATVLLARAARPVTPPWQAAADIREAARLARRRAGFWRVRNVDDLLARHDALAALDRLTGRVNVHKRHRAWRKSLDREWLWSITEQARLAQAWAEWAASTGVAAFAAEAYYYLVGLAAQDAVTRYRESARQHALAAAQEYAEEAGYWLARSGFYREAVEALEMGRAVGLTQVLGRRSGPATERLRAAGRLDLDEEYGRALATFAGLERQGSPQLRRAWAELRNVAARVKAVTGIDPLAIDAHYEDVLEQTGDGALAYVAAATAGGYALVVAAHHDPQFVDLPRLGRAAVLSIADTLLPGATTLAGARSSVARAADARDAEVLGRSAGSSTAEGLRTLWTDGLRNLLLTSARGRVVSFVPVGLLSLLPLHAAGEPGPPDDQHSGWRHAGGFSAVRYAPNARALGPCRRTARAAEAGLSSLLAVDAALGPGYGPDHRLGHVARETAEVARRWVAGPAAAVHDCTWDQFHTLAGQHTVWHLACHASATPTSIMDSQLVFTDRAVTLAELRHALPPGPRRLAVLSACQTNVTGAAMPNEMVGLPSALIELGFAGVIASAWLVDDLATTYLMTAFYHWWQKEGEEPPVALNHAQHWLRMATRDTLAATLPGIVPAGDRDSIHPYADARFWAPFAYTGV